MADITDPTLYLSPSGILATSSGWLSSYLVIQEPSRYFQVKLWQLQVHTLAATTTCTYGQSLDLVFKCSTGAIRFIIGMISMIRFIISLISRLIDISTCIYIRMHVTILGVSALGGSWALNFWDPPSTPFWPHATDLTCSYFSWLIVKLPGDSRTF